MTCEKGLQPPAKRLLSASFAKSMLGKFAVQVIADLLEPLGGGVGQVIAGDVGGND